MVARRPIRHFSPVKTDKAVDTADLRDDATVHHFLHTPDGRRRKRGKQVVKSYPERKALKGEENVCGDILD